MPAQINDFWMVVIFVSGAFGMWVSYKKGKVDLENMKKTTVLKEYELEQTIERSKRNEILAIENQKNIRIVLTDMDSSKKEIRMLLKANLNTMQSLKDKGINGKTAESIQEIQDYLLNG